MDPDAVEHVKWSIQEYAQLNSAMRGSRDSKGVQYGRGRTYSTTTCSTFTTQRSQLYQFWVKEGFRSLDQALIMCEMVDPSTSRSARVMCVAAIYIKKQRNRNRGYEGQIEGTYPGEKMQRTRVHIQSNDQPHIQVGVAEAPNNTRE